MHCEGIGVRSSTPPSERVHGRRRVGAAVLVAALLGTLLAALPGSPAAAAPSVPSRLESIDPVRVLDTRTSSKVVAGNSVGVPINGRVPSNATAVVLNLTVTDPEAFGFVTAYSGSTRPGTSNANTDQLGETAANLVIVPLTVPGDVRVYASTTTNLVIDLLGWFVPAAGSTAGRYRPVAPAGGRILDTRGEGAPGALGAAGRRVQITGRGGVPASGVRAVAVNVTMTQTVSGGWLQVIPTNGTTAAGASSNVNVSSGGQTVANLVIVPVGADGSVTLVGNAIGHVIVDVAGWFTDSSATSGTDGLFIAVDPTRLADTRAGARVQAGATLAVSAAVAGVDAGQIGSVLANLTVTQSEAPLFVTGYAGIGTIPQVSSINADKADATVANAGIVATNGPSFGLFSSAATHLVVDLLGWFTRSGDLATNGQPGSVISSAAHPSGGQLIRYRSIGAAGGMTQQKTLLFTPAGAPPSGGWPVMVVGHGPIGLGAQCAISAIARASYPDPIDPWLQAGYAVVYPDLEAIGEPGIHPYFHGPGTGRSMLDAMRAARAVDARLSNRGFSSGLSAGGHAALWFAEEAVTYAPDIDVRGAIALDPVASLSGYVQADSFAVMIMQGMRAGTPSLDYSQILQQAAINRLPQLNAGCRDDTFALFADLPNQGLLTSNPMSVPAWAAAFRASDPGHRRTSPVLLVAAEGPVAPGDFAAIPHELHNLYINRACAQNTPLQTTIVQGGHIAVRTAGLPAAITWANQRLTSGQTGCAPL
jgi:hypothetical protein